MVYQVSTNGTVLLIFPFLLLLLFCKYDVFSAEYILIQHSTYQSTRQDTITNIIECEVTNPPFLVFMQVSILFAPPPWPMAELREGKALPTPPRARGKRTLGGCWEGFALPELSLWPRGGGRFRFFENFHQGHQSYTHEGICHLVHTPFFEGG